MIKHLLFCASLALASSQISSYGNDESTKSSGLDNKGSHGFISRYGSDESIKSSGYSLDIKGSHGFISRYGSDESTESSGYSLDNKGSHGSTSGYNLNKGSHSSISDGYSDSYGSHKSTTSSGYSDSYGSHKSTTSSGYSDSYGSHKSTTSSGYSDSYGSHKSTTSSGYSDSYGSHKSTTSSGYGSHKSTTSSGYSDSYGSQKSTTSSGYGSDKSTKSSGCEKEVQGIATNASATGPGASDGTSIICTDLTVSDLPYTTDTGMNRITDLSAGSYFYLKVNDKHIKVFYIEADSNWAGDYSSGSAGDIGTLSSPSVSTSPIAQGSVSPVTIITTGGSVQSFTGFVDGDQINITEFGDAIGINTNGFVDFDGLYPTFSKIGSESPMPDNLSTGTYYAFFTNIDNTGTCPNGVLAIGLQDGVASSDNNLNVENGDTLKLYFKSKNCGGKTCGSSGGHRKRRKRPKRRKRRRRHYSDV